MPSQDWKLPPSEANTPQGKSAASMALATLALHGEVDAIGAGLIAILQSYPGDVRTCALIAAAGWASYLVASSYPPLEPDALGDAIDELVKGGAEDWSVVWHRASAKLLTAAAQARDAAAKAPPPPAPDWSTEGGARASSEPANTKGFPPA